MARYVFMLLHVYLPFSPLASPIQGKYYLYNIQRIPTKFKVLSESLQRA